MTILYIFLFLFGFSVIYAFACGGMPEKLVAAVFVIGFFMTKELQSDKSVRYNDFEVGVFFVDVLMMMAIILISLYAERYWTIWMSAMQFIQVLAHIPRLIIPDILPRAYAFTVSFWALPMIILLIAATYRHRSRKKEFGFDPSWSPASKNF